MGFDMAGLTAGIVGTGRIGVLVAKILAGFTHGSKRQSGPGGIPSELTKSPTRQPGYKVMMIFPWAFPVCI